VDEGNGDHLEESEKLVESEDEDLSLESEVNIVMDDESVGKEEVRKLVKELTATVKRLTKGLGTQGEEIESLRTQLGGMRTEVVERLDTCINKENWSDYCRDTYAFVNKKSRLLLGYSEVSGTAEKLQKRVVIAGHQWEAHKVSKGC